MVKVEVDNTYGKMILLWFSMKSTAATKALFFLLNESDLYHSHYLVYLMIVTSYTLIMIIHNN